MRKCNGKKLSIALLTSNIIMSVLCLADSLCYALCGKHVIFRILNAAHISTLAEVNEMPDAFFQKNWLSELPYNLLIVLIICNLAMLVFKDTPRRVSVSLLLCTLWLFAYVSILH